MPPIAPFCPRCGYALAELFGTDLYGNLVVYRRCTHCAWGQILPESS